MSHDDGLDAASADRFEYHYDVENRLTKVDYDDDGDGPNALVPMASYRYDAQGRRVEYIDETRNVTVRYAYDGANAIVEYEYDSSSLTGTRSYVHGTQYIDERAVMRDHAQDPVAGDYQNGQDHYYLLKDLYTVAGLVGCNGGPEEYYVYDTYGHVTIYAWPVGTSASWESTSDLNRDGVVTSADVRRIYNALQDGDTNPIYDLDFSGDLTSEDHAIVLAIYLQQPSAIQVNYSTVDNPYFFTGRLTDTLHADDLVAANDLDGVKRLQDNRNRTYDPKHGRWLQRDPQGVRYLAEIEVGGLVVEIEYSLDPADQYSDGSNLYAYVNANPLLYVDAWGLQGGPDSVQWHHLLPNDFDEQFLKSGIDQTFRNQKEYGWEMPRKDHIGDRASGTKGIHPDWNKEWKEFFGKYEKKNKTPTKRQILNHLKKMENMEEFKTKLNNEGNRATRSYPEDKAYKAKLRRAQANKTPVKTKGASGSQAGKATKCKGVKINSVNVSFITKVGKKIPLFSVVNCTQNIRQNGFIQGSLQSVYDAHPLSWQLDLLLDQERQFQEQLYQAMQGCLEQQIYGDGPRGT